LLGGPTADVSAAVQENLEQADDAHVVDFDSRISRPDFDNQGSVASPSFDVLIAAGQWPGSRSLFLLSCRRPG
jgi:hypothetical protein